MTKHKPKAYFNWSSGKDASLALHYMQQEGKYEIDCLLTSVNGHHNRVSMHGLRSKLLEAQAKAIGLLLTVISLPKEPDMDTYSRLMGETVQGLKSAGYLHCAFGDIFLEDLRSYREEQLRPHNITCHFPLWKKDTRALIKAFIELGFKAIVICVKAELLDESFVGRNLDIEFVESLPEGVDPCGENGEFHTFCYDGPIFNNPVPFEIGDKVYREYNTPKEKAGEKMGSMGFWFCDLIPFPESRDAF